MSQDIRSFFLRSRGDSPEKNNTKKLVEKTPEKQRNGHAAQAKRLSDSRNKEAAEISGNGHGNLGRKRKGGYVIVSDESDAEDSVPSELKRKRAEHRKNGAVASCQQKTQRHSTRACADAVPVPGSKRVSTDAAAVSGSVSYLGIEKPAKTIHVPEKLLASLDKEHADAALSRVRASADASPASGSKHVSAGAAPHRSKRLSTDAAPASGTVSYLGIEKPAKNIRVPEKLLAALDKAHADVRTPVNITPPKAKANGGISSSPKRTRSKATSDTSLHETRNGGTIQIDLDDQLLTSVRAPKKTPVKNSDVSPNKPQCKAVFDAKLQSAPIAKLPWSEKYRPTTMKQILGQQGDKSCMKKLYIWLKDWTKWHGSGKPSKATTGDGWRFKAALLSGPPGIGKTTTAQVVCRELGLNLVELNASDTRNKRNLHQVVAECLASHSMKEYGDTETKMQTSVKSAKTVLIMDEVDGMSGNEDRAGIAELIALVKTTRVPIICICNDRYSQKIRSLSFYCYDLRFHRPQLPQIRSAIMSILFKESLKLPPSVVDQIIDSCGRDIRHVLNHMNFLAASLKDSEEANSSTKHCKKDESVNVFEAVRRLFSASDETQPMTMNERTEVFFNDYDLVPLFVQENYLKISPAQAKDKIDLLERVSSAADLLSVGDVIDRQIRTNQNWSLLSDKAMFSTVLPSDIMKGRFHGQVTFPSWFGKFQKHNRLRRLVQQLQVHSACRASASTVSSWITDYAPAIRMRSTQPLLKHYAETSKAVKGVLKTLEWYALTLEDRDAVMEITNWPSLEEQHEKVPSRMQRALTIGYRKQAHKLPYAVGDVEKSKKRATKKQDASDDEEDGIAQDLDELELN